MQLINSMFIENTAHEGGAIYTRSWEDSNQVRHYRTEVITEQVKFLERKSEDNQTQETNEEKLPLQRCRGGRFISSIQTT